jgi:hypothetical protein
MKKVAIFAWFGCTISTSRFDIGDDHRRRIDRRDFGAPSLYETWGFPLTAEHTSDIAQLGSIVDERLLVFDATELVYAYELSNDAFWEVIERL